MNNQPFFSIIIPTYNRPDKLSTCLESLTHLNYPRDNFEVIVVDDGSKIPLDNIVNFSHNQLNIALIRQQNSGPAIARNTGAAKANGQYLVFTDDDCTLTPDFLTNLANYFLVKTDYLIGGKTVNYLTDNLYSTASQVLIDYLYSYYNTCSPNVNFFASNNFAVSSNLFHKIGGFDSTFTLAAGEDREFCDRWIFYGYKMIYAPEAIVYHSHELTLTKFLRQHFNYGRGIFYLQKTRVNRQSGGIKFESITFYVNLLSYPFRKLKSNQKIFIFGLFILSQISTTVGLIWEIAYQYNLKKTI
jgi:GT2 family glycosyltransferase